MALFADTSPVPARLCVCPHWATVNWVTGLWLSFDFDFQSLFLFLSAVHCSVYGGRTYGALLMEMIGRQMCVHARLTACRCCWCATAHSLCFCHCLLVLIELDSQLHHHTHTHHQRRWRVALCCLYLPTALLQQIDSMTQWRRRREEAEAQCPAGAGRVSQFVRASGGNSPDRKLHCLSFLTCLNSLLHFSLAVLLSKYST